MGNPRTKSNTRYRVTVPKEVEHMDRIPEWASITIECMTTNILVTCDLCNHFAKNDVSVKQSDGKSYHYRVCNDCAMLWLVGPNEGGVAPLLRYDMLNAAMNGITYGQELRIRSSIVRHPSKCRYTVEDDVTNQIIFDGDWMECLTFLADRYNITAY